jgi:signal transduction histidine kinase/CheY-like chemotaxis protein
MSETPNVWLVRIDAPQVPRLLAAAGRCGARAGICAISQLADALSDEGRAVVFTNPRAVTEVLALVRGASRTCAVVVFGDLSVEAAADVVARGCDDAVPVRIGDEELDRRVAVTVARLQRSEVDDSPRESLGAIVGGIAHDFNNALTTILTTTRLLRGMHADSEHTLEALRQVETAARRAAGITEHMLAYAGRRRTEPRTLQIGEIAAELAPTLEAMMPEGVRIHCDVPGALPPIEADPSQLRQLLVAIVGNAAEAMTERTGTVELRVALVDLGDRRPEATFVAADAPAGPWITVEVRDTGSGIAARHLRRVFDPFFTTKERRRGLGLAAALGIVRAHHGAIHAESTPGECTIVRAYFPASPPEASRSSGSIPVVSDQPGVSVLVADDEKALRSTLERLLVQFGFRVLVAADGRTTVDLVRAHAHELDVLLLDIGMPDLTGAQVLRRVRELVPTLPVLLMSGYLDEPLVGDVEDDPHTEFVAKPFEPLALLHRLGELGRRPRER